MGDRQVRAIVRTDTKKAAAKAFDVSMNHFNDHMCETGNEEELAAANSMPVGVLLVMKEVYVPADGKYHITRKY